MTRELHNRGPEDSSITRFTGSYAAFNDAALVSMIRGGDEMAFECIMKRYLPMVNAFLWGKMWERHEISDLSQEIFIRAYSRIDQLRDGAKFNQWVMQIARHAWRDYCRNPATQRAKQHVAIDDEQASVAKGLVDPGADPSKSAGEQEFSLIVQKAIGELKERYRVILYLRLIDEKSNVEIAELTGLKENAVRTRFSRGLEALRKALIKKGLAPF